jgi:hypothetical protein
VAAAPVTTRYSGGTSCSRRQVEAKPWCSGSVATAAIGCQRTERLQDHFVIADQQQAGRAEQTPMPVTGRTGRPAVT